MQGLVTIQCLRGIAAISVILCHTCIAFGGDFEVGAAGVDMFFVISGFIMWVTTAKDAPRPGRFLWRRITRLVPLYWIVLLFTTAAVLLRPQFFPDGALSLRNFFGSLVFFPIISVDILHPPVIQGWTLSFEMMFYTLFSLALFLPPMPRLLVVIGVLGALALSHPFMAFGGYGWIFTQPIILEFGVGVMIGWIWQNGVELPMPLSMLLISVGVLILARDEWLVPDYPRLLGWGAPSAMIVAGAVFAERKAKPLRLEWLTVFGDASYSIYLWHMLMGVAVMGVALHFGVPQVWSPELFAFGGFGMGMVLHFVLERPLLDLFRKRRVVRAPAAVASSLVPS